MIVSCCGIRRRQLLIFAFVILLSNILLDSHVTAQTGYPSCNTDSNYTSNSTYGTNLNTVLSFLSRNITENGFYNATVGQNRDTVNALALCRGDVLLQGCRDCVRDAAADLRRQCPDQTQAVMWYEFCMVRYSNEPIMGIVENSLGIRLQNTRNVSSPNEFRADLRTLLDDLRGRAINGGPLRKVAAGTRPGPGPDNDTIFAMVQCTPDLLPELCTGCLTDAAASAPISRGARVLRASCNLRYEIYRFYNETRLRELDLVLPPPAPPPSPVGGTPPATPPSAAGGGDSNTSRIVVIIVVVSVVVCLILVLLGICFMRKRMKRRRLSEPHGEAGNGEISTVESLQYDFGKVRDATDNFSDVNKLGEGGFGAVYKGMLPSGQEIAVKRLSRSSGQGDLEFKNEVLLLARLQHRNLVRLLGFSLEGTEKVLVYEFVENASLDKFIFDSSRGSSLDWDRRYKIIGGIARGLLYLHEDSRLRIIHRDLKASNVLLDRDMTPKIADFGMARLFDTDETQGSTSRIVGTYGYMSPEYAMRGQFSVKSDVFSFGVLVLEIISGQRNNSFGSGENIQDLISCAWKYWREGNAVNIVDPVIRTASGVPRDLLRCIHIGLLCVQENAFDRPTMASVVLMLNSFSITLPVPSEPAFFVPSGYDSDFAHLQKVNYSRETESSKSSKSAKSAHYSQNEASISELYPR